MKSRCLFFRYRYEVPNRRNFNEDSSLWNFWDKTCRWDTANNRPTYQDNRNCVVIQPNGDKFESLSCGARGHFVCLHGADIGRPPGNGTIHL